MGSTRTTRASAISAIVFALALYCAPAFADVRGEGFHGPVGHRIAAWAETFVGVPYDTDPLGLYVRTNRIVADESVDCMYLTFRSVELAMSASAEEAVDRALTLRFRTYGRLDERGMVVNYGERFEYGLDMVMSGRWGRNVTASLSRTATIEGSRGVDTVEIIPKDAAASSIAAMRSGDIVFFVKPPEKRVAGEVVGHIGIVKREGDVVYLIHASGTKSRGGEVKKLPLSDYAAAMGFAGIIVTRFGF